MTAFFFKIKKRTETLGLTVARYQHQHQYINCCTKHHEIVAATFFLFLPFMLFHHKATFFHILLTCLMTTRAIGARRCRFGLPLHFALLIVVGTRMRLISVARGHSPLMKPVQLDGDVFYG